LSHSSAGSWSDSFKQYTARIAKFKPAQQKAVGMRKIARKAAYLKRMKTNLVIDVHAGFGAVIIDFRMGFAADQRERERTQQHQGN
jgi:hypothetical protein